MQTQLRTVEHVIAGRPETTAEHYGDVWNPATGELAARVPFAGAAVVDRAVGAAHAAFGPWSQTPIPRRAAVMFAFRQRVLDDIDRLARIITGEHGKTLDDARAEIARGLDVVEFACGIAQLLKGEYSANVSRDIDSYAHRFPIGVCAGITPFNFPAMVPMWMFPLAIACGNAFVLKPSERDPSLASELARHLRAAGLPDGVFSVLHGDGATVASLVDHPLVAACSFVGSTPVARSVFARANAAGKRVQALGGAKNHLVVMPDAPVADCVEAIAGAAYGSAGERCMAVSVVVAVGEAADALVDALRERIGRLRIGPGDQPGMDMGPLVTAAHRDRVRDYIEGAEREGATLVCDGRAAHVPELGYFLGATLLDRVDPAMRCYREEIFGPVLCVMRVANLNAAIALINAHEFGNGASIFTADGAAAQRFERQTQAGMIGINVPIPVPMAFHSFGGWKASLFGDHHVHGAEGVRFYTRLKTTTARWETSRGGDGSFVMPTAR